MCIPWLPYKALGFNLTYLSHFDDLVPSVGKPGEHVGTEEVKDRDEYRRELRLGTLVDERLQEGADNRPKSEVRHGRQTLKIHRESSRYTKRFG